VIALLLVALSALIVVLELALHPANFPAPTPSPGIRFDA
jgi:hypothetical protein